MVRFFLFFLVILTIGTILHETRPTVKDFRAELDSRFLNVKSDPAAFSRMVGKHPLDNLVSTLPPWHAIAQTRVDDYQLFRVFTTEYYTDRGPRLIQTFGLGRSFFTLPDRAGMLASHRSAETPEPSRSASW